MSEPPQGAHDNGSERRACNRQQIICNEQTRRDRVDREREKERERGSSERDSYRRKRVGRSGSVSVSVLAVNVCASTSVCVSAEL